MRERWDFARRSWRHHPVLSAIRLACALGLTAAGVARLLGNDERWLSGVTVGLFAGIFLCSVLLVRRDEDPADEARGHQPRP